jgi:HEAT repeats
MGWWSTEEGTDEMVGDGPADQLGTVLRESIGETFDDELFTGFVVALAGALRRNPAELLARPEELDGAALVVTFTEKAPIRVPIPKVPTSGMLADALHQALDGVAMQYRESEVERPPTLNEIARTLAFVARGQITDAENGRPLDLITLRAVRDDAGEKSRRPGARSDPTTNMRWTAIRTIASGMAAVTGEIETVLADALEDKDWRVRMTAVLAVGRFRISSLANQARAASLPGTDAGLRDEDRRALLALRDIAVERAGAGGDRPPVHPEPLIAAKRAAFRKAVEDAMSGAAVPAPDNSIYVLRALERPEDVMADPAAPVIWRQWMGVAPGTAERTRPL